MPPADGRPRPVLSARERRLAGALAAAGAAAFAYGAAFGDAARAWQALLVNFLFFTGLAQAGVVLSALVQATSARWARPLKRAAEATAGFLPVSLVLLAVLLAGLPAWAPWAGAADHTRQGWLATSWFAAREGAGFLLLLGVSAAYLYHSVRPDVGLLQELDRRPVDGPASRLVARWCGSAVEREAGQRRQSQLAPVVLIAYGWVFSLVAFDFVMALDRHWYSTLAGGYFFTGNLLGGVALLALAAACRERLGLAAHVGRRQLHDLGTLLFGFAILWAYLLWSQYLVIWYGDLPEETAFVAHRLQGAWAPVTWLAVGLMFLLPFVVLLSRRVKTSARGLAAVAAAVLAGLWLERFVLVAPSLASGGGLPLGLPELLVTAGALGAFVLCYARVLETVPVLPISDPKLAPPASAGEAAPPAVSAPR